MFESVRGATGYDTPRVITLPFTTKSAAISFDGLAIYAIKELGADGPTELWAADRARVEDTFGNPHMIHAGYMAAPTLSPDQREVYFHDARRAMQNTVLRLTRPSISDGFDSAATPQVIATGTHPYVADTGELLIFVDPTGTIRALRRSCGA